MLIYTSTALVSLVFSFSSIPAVKTADYTVALQPTTVFQTTPASLARLPHPLSHRGSGRVDYRMIG